MRKMSDIVRNQDPVTLPPHATVREACRCMRDRRVGAVLVTTAIVTLSASLQVVTRFTVCSPREKVPLAHRWPTS
jgi:CBS domain-containing protein